MKILFLAPQPFFVARGTPIAVRHLLEHFSARGWDVDALVFPGGQPLSIPRVLFFKVPFREVCKPIRPGLSLRKLWYDLHLFIAAWRRVRRERYDYIHGVEESAFMAWILHHWKKIPFVCDMDSSIPDQIAENHGIWRLTNPILKRMESAMLRDSSAVLAVCDSLGERARRLTRAPVMVLRDPPLHASGATADLSRDSHAMRPAFVYVGNLQHYQGIQLLLKSLQRVLAQAVQVSLIIVGGEALDVEALERKCARMRLENHVQFVGACTVEESSRYLDIADVLVSPRLHGVNTPMKLYSYLHAGKAILATDIPAHTQVLTPEHAVLVPPQPEALADAMVQLAQNAELRQRLGASARQLSDSRYSRAAYDQTADEFCALMESLATSRKV